ncbi:MAG TPA: GYD domain-containing protein [Actinomycetota bacterium]
MAKYLFTVQLTQQGAAGTMKEGGTGRREVVEKMAAGLGATIEAFYYAFGENDVYIIVDAPDPEAVIAISLTVSASGAAAVTTTPLITAEEVDAARDRTVDYRPPGA